MALVCGATGRGVAFGDLKIAVADKARQFSLPALGGRKALVFLAIRNRPEDVVALLAALTAGHAVALLGADLAHERWHRLIDAYRPEFLVGVPPAATPDGAYDRLEGGVAPEPAVLAAVEPGAGTALPINAELAILLSTSGSTGSPKFVRLSHANLWHNARAIAEVLGITDRDVGCAHLPLHYSYGLSVLTSHLGAGAATAILDHAITEGAFWTKLKSFGCTSFPGVPSHFDLLRRLRVPRLDFAAVRFCTQAGGKLGNAMISELAPQLQAKGIALFIMYGQTEASPRLTTLPAHEVLNKIGSVGPPLPGGRFDVIGPDGRPLPAGQSGEIVYSGPNVMLGYAESRAALAAGDEQGGRLPTGDIGHLDADGYLYIDGRKSRFAKVQGYRVSLDDVERIVSRHGTAIALEHEDGICLVIRGGSQERADAMAEALRRELDIYPDAVTTRLVDAYPLLSSGKIDYETLKGELS